MAKDRLSGKLAVILHADVAGSTALVQKNEQLAHERIQDAFQRFSDTIEKYHGRVQELRGDALLAEFERASDAVTAALSFQTDQNHYNANLNDLLQPTVRVGIAMGEVVIADNTITGTGVVLAQRLEQLAEPGGVVIQGAAYETIPGRFPFEFKNLGEHEAKGFDEPVRVFSANLKTDTDIPPPDSAIHKTRNTIIALVSLAVVIFGVALMWVKPWEVREEPASVERMTLPLPDRPSIAVLPFEMLGDESTQDYLGDGLSNDLITALSKFSNLFVIASYSSFTYKGKPVKAQTVSEELGVRYVLKGSVQKSTEGTRINVQLIDALSGRHLWAERFDRQAKDFLKIQDEIVESVVANLAIQVDALERERVKAKHAGNLEAYDYYLRANDIRFDWDKATNREARQLLEKAIELDPNYARAYSALAWTHVNDWRWGWVKDLEASRTLALKTARKAAELDPFDPESHHALGVVHLYNREFDKAIPLYEKAIALNPNDARRLVGTAPAWIYLGQTKKAVAQIESALRLNPHHSDDDLNFLGWAYYEAKEYEKALATLKKIEKSPWHAVLAATYVRLGRMEEARAEVTTVLKINPEYSLERGEIFPYRYDDQKRHYYDALAKAGMPKHPPLKLPDKPSIAVLPFTNMSDDAEQEYFVDGMTEDLITDLSKVSGLRVIAFREEPPIRQDLVHKFKIRYQLVGSVRRLAGRVRINVRLVDNEDGSNVWTERYDRELEDVFTLQEKVAQQVVGALSLTLTGEELDQLSRSQTASFDAYDAFLQGQRHTRNITRESNLVARQLYERAIELDSGFARAYGALSVNHAVAFRRGWTEYPDKTLSLAVVNAEKAATLDNTSMHILWALGYSYLFKKEYQKAIDALEKAIHIAPSYADAYGLLALINNNLGRYEQAAEQIRKAMVINPVYTFEYPYLLGWALYGAERYEEAIETLAKAIERNESALAPHLFLAASYVGINQQDDAEWEIEQILVQDPEYTTSKYYSMSRMASEDELNRFLDALRKAGLPD